MKLKVWGCTGSIPRCLTEKDIENRFIEMLEFIHDNKSMLHFSGYKNTDSYTNYNIFKEKCLPYYGGNTTCFEIRVGDIIIIIDAGTGIRNCGNALAAEFGFFGPNPKPLNLVMLLTHYHHDHLQGLPFFFPAYRKETNIQMMGLSHTGHPHNEMISVVKHYLREEQSTPFFPMPYEKLASKREHTDLVPGDIREFGHKITGKTKYSENGEIGMPEIKPQVRITAFALHHPDGALGYIIEELETGKKIVLSADCEPLKNNQFLGCVPNQTLGKGCDLYIGDGMYTEAEYNMFAGFGHGTPTSVMMQADMIQAKKCAVTHHNPSHSDSQLFEMEKQAKEDNELFKAIHSFSPNDVVFLKEGMELEI